MTQEQIITRYVELAVEKQQIPTLIRFSNWSGIDLPSIRKHFANADALQSFIWESIFKRTYKALLEDEGYAEYAAYERLLAFHFTFLQIADEYRTFLELKLKGMGPVSWESKDMKELKQLFLRFVGEISVHGKETGEIPNRMIGGQYLNRITWYQLLYLLHFWVRDESELYGNTDAATEKSTQFVFDILGRNVVDTSVDFGKFFVQNFSFKNWVKW